MRIVPCPSRTSRAAVIALALVGCGAIGSLPAQAGALGNGLSASNQARIWIVDSTRAASYLNYFDLQYAQGPWLVGARLELDEEDRYDAERLLETSRRFAEYRDGSVTLRAGNFYATFGRGLLLRAQEDETVRLDRDIDGLYGALRWKALDGQGFIGRPRHDETDEREALLSGVEIGARPHAALRLSSGYVRYDAADALGSGANRDDPDLGKPLEELVGTSVQWRRGVLDATLEAAHRFARGEIDPSGGWKGSDDEDGAAYYGALTVAVPGYTVLVEGKDYLRFGGNLAQGGVRAAYSTLPPCNGDGQPVNQGEDERGFGVTFTASPRPEITIETAGAWAGERNGISERQSASGSIRRDWWSAGAIKLGGEWVEETELESHVHRRWIGPTLEASYYLTPSTSLSFHGKFFDWINRPRAVGVVCDEPGDEYTEITADLTASFGMSRAVTLSVIKASSPIPEYNCADTWVSLQLSWAFGYNHDLTVKIGEERGGVVCSGGVCHYEPPFTGVRVELLSRL